MVKCCNKQSAVSQILNITEKFLLAWNLNSDASQNYKYMFGPHRGVYKASKAKVDKKEVSDTADLFWNLNP